MSEPEHTSEVQSAERTDALAFPIRLRQLTKDNDNLRERLERLESELERHPEAPAGS